MSEPIETVVDLGGDEAHERGDAPQTSEVPWRQPVDDGPPEHAVVAERLADLAAVASSRSLSAKERDEALDNLLRLFRRPEEAPDA